MSEPDYTITVLVEDGNHKEVFRMGALATKDDLIGPGSETPETAMVLDYLSRTVNS
jgi:hypothetical protein